MISTSIGGIYETPLDVAKFAESMGLKATTCHTLYDLTVAIKEALHMINETNKPIVIEALVLENEIPPTTGSQ